MAPRHRACNSSVVFYILCKLRNLFTSFSFSTFILLQLC